MKMVTWKTERYREYQKAYKQAHPMSLEYKRAYTDENREHIYSKQKERQRNNKRKAIEHLGGKCSKCNNVYPEYVYDFHHKDPSEKEKSIARMLSRKWDRLKVEIDKCVLLCANCHRIVHHGLEAELEEEALSD